MKYAAGMPGEAVVIIAVAPKSVVIDGEPYRVTHTELVNGSQYKLSFFNVETNEPQTVTLDKTDEAIQYHPVQAELKKMGKGGYPVYPIEDEAFLQDRTFRDAWELVGSELTVNMPKAREVHRNHMRRARRPKLEDADVRYFKALENVNVKPYDPESKDSIDLQTISSEKQELRDVTDMPEIDAAQTPEELKAVWPDILK